VSGGQDVRDAQLESLIEIRKGQPLAMADVRETILHAMGMGRFLDVRVSALEAGEAVRVEIDFVALRGVRRLLFAGDLGISERAVRAAVVDRFGPTPASGRAADIAQVVEDLLRDRGYLRAVVRPRGLGASDADAGDMVFDVAAGVQARVRTVTFRPAETEAVRALRDRLDIRPGARYDRAELRKQLASYTDNLRARHYLEARADPGVQTSESGDSVDLTITLSQGPLVSVEFAGDPLPPKRLADLVPVAREASVDEDLLEDSELRIEEYLRAQGYRDAKATFEKIPEGDRLRIVFTVTNGPLYRVSGPPQFEGTTLVPEADLRPLVGLVVGQPFTQAGLDTDVAALLAEYRRRGFGDATCAPAPVPVPGERTAGEARVVVAFRFNEGPRTLVSEVDPAGNTVLSDSDVRAGLATREGAPLFGPAVEADRDRILVKYLNLGYRLARIHAAITFSGDRTRAHVRFTIREGPQIIVDHILVVGNDRIADAIIRREVTLQPGQPLGLEAISESQRRLAALGLFRRVTISELRHGLDHLRDVLVSVEESPATSLGYGGGVEFQKVETVEFAPRGFFEIGRRNLWGKNRSINFFSRVSLRRRSESVAATATLPAATTEQTTIEYRVIGSYREPKALGSSADLQVTLGFEQGSRTSFSFRSRSARVNLSQRYGPKWSLLGQYSIGRDTIFDDRINPVDRPLIDRLFPEVRIGSVSSSAVRNTRDDAFDPGKGGLIGLNLELALRPLGSEVGFAKTFLQGFIYRQIPSSRRIVLAGGARLGLGTGFPRDAPVPGPDGEPILGEDGQPLTRKVRDLPASERFFAGGDTTVRGFERDRLGRPDTLDRDGTPIGGHAEIILNGEVRVALWKDVGAVGFLDTGNVFAIVNDVRLRDLRAGAGFGIRYKSPVGPIRFDFGFKLGTLQTYPTYREDRFALHISIGQAF
jgi:outer membrane protein assembly complex protein YaeT